MMIVTVYSRDYHDTLLTQVDKQLKSKWEKMNAKKPLNINWHLKYVHKLTLLLLILWGCLIKENGVSAITSSSLSLTHKTSWPHLMLIFSARCNLNTLLILVLKKCQIHNDQAAFYRWSWNSFFILVHNDFNFFFFFFSSKHTDYCLAFFLLLTLRAEKKEKNRHRKKWILYDQ